MISYERDDVVRHAPDDGRYHLPDNDQARSGRRAVRGLIVTVPRARMDGSSSAFDAHKAAPVHVDPHMPDGGVIVDIPHLTNDRIHDAIRKSSYMHEAYYRLGVSPAAQPAAVDTLPICPLGRDVEKSALYTPQHFGNPIGGHTVPASTLDGRQVPHNLYEQELGSMSRLSVPPPAPPVGVAISGRPAQQTQPPLAPAPTPMAGMPMPAQFMENVFHPPQQPLYAPQPLPPAAPLPSVSDALLGQMAALMQGISARLTNLEQQHQEAKQHVPPPAASPPIVAATVPGMPARVARSFEQSARHQSEEEHSQPPASGEVRAPHLRVVFDMGQSGRATMSYHDIIETEDALILVTDIRYEGAQFTPPQLPAGAQMKLTIPEGKERKDVVVQPTRFSFPRGEFDYLVFSIARESVESYEDHEPVARAVGGFFG